MMLHSKSAVAALQIYRTSESGTGRTAMISISRSMMLAAGLLALSMGGAVAQGSMQFGGVHYAARATASSPFAGRKPG